MTGAACNRSTTGSTARGNTGKAHLFGLRGWRGHAGRRIILGYVTLRRRDCRNWFLIFSFSLYKGISSSCNLQLYF